MMTILSSAIILSTLFLLETASGNANDHRAQYVEQAITSLRALEADLQPVGGISGAISKFSGVDSNQLAQSFEQYEAAKSRRSGRKGERAMPDMLGLLSNVGDILGYMKWLGEMLSALSSYGGNALGSLSPVAEAGVQGAGSLASSVGGLAAEAATNASLGTGAADVAANFGVHGNMGNQQADQQADDQPAGRPPAGWWGEDGWK